MVALDVIGLVSKTDSPRLSEVEVAIPFRVRATKYLCQLDEPQFVLISTHVTMVMKSQPVCSSTFGLKPFSFVQASHLSFCDSTHL